MKHFILNNGLQFEVYDDSDRYQISMIGSGDTVKELLENLTPANLKNAKIDDEIITNVIYDGASITPINEATGELSIILSFREKTQEEMIKQKFEEYDEALIEIADMVAALEEG